MRRGAATGGGGSLVIVFALPAPLNVVVALARAAMFAAGGEDGGKGDAVVREVHHLVVRVPQFHS